MCSRARAYIRPSLAKASERSRDNEQDSRESWEWGTLAVLLCCSLSPILIYSVFELDDGK